MKAILNTILNNIFLITGTLLFIYAFIHFIYYKRFLKSAVKTDGTVTRVVDGSDGPPSIFVKFIVDGKEYEGMLYGCDISVKEEDTVPVYFNPKKPKRFRGRYFNRSIYALMVFALILIVVSLFIERK